MRIGLLYVLVLLIGGCESNVKYDRVARVRGSMSDLAVGVEERKVPYSQELRYPEDWPEISATRDGNR